MQTVLKIGFIYFKQSIINLFPLSFWLKYDLEMTDFLWLMLLKICCYFLSSLKNGMMFLYRSEFKRFIVDLLYFGLVWNEEF